MPIEIERKFLVCSAGWRAEVHKTIAMRHGYLTAHAGKASVRVRLEGEIGKLNVKSAVTGMSRAEYEYEIPATEASEILLTLCDALILKTRHYIERDGVVWEVDVFEGANAGLVVAEVELDSEMQSIVKPGWLGREVTSERRYYNNALAATPYTEWPLTERN